jgi:hypothetical protein
MSILSTTITTSHQATSLKMSNSVNRNAFDDSLSADSFELTTDANLTHVSISAPKDYFIRNLAGDDILVSLDGAVTWPISVPESGAVLFSLDVAGSTASGVLTMDTQPADTDTIIIGSRTYTWEAVLTDVDGNIWIGADLAAAKLNLGYAISASGGVAGVDYAPSMTANTEVRVGLFSDDDALFSSAEVGVASNSYASVISVTGGNTFSAATLLGGGVLPEVFAKSKGVSQAQVQVVPN